MLISVVTFIQCGKLPDIENGVAVYPSEGAASYACNKGYALSTPAEVTNQHLTGRISNITDCLSLEIVISFNFKPNMT